MKLGINVMADTGIHPDTVDYNWAVGMEGVTIRHDFEEVYDNLTPAKRGIILKPYLIDGKDTYDIASAHYELLTYHNPAWNNGVPLIIDIWGNPEGTTRFQFEHIKIYLTYLTERYDFVELPLLRVTSGQWDSWYTSNRNEALKLLEHCDLLLAHWGAEQPNEVLHFGTLPWWEYQPHKIAYDTTLKFEGINVPEEPIEEPDPIEPLPVALPEWKILIQVGNYMLVKII